jgi:hypothetical protein
MDEPPKHLGANIKFADNFKAKRQPSKLRREEFDSLYPLHFRASILRIRGFVVSGG